MSEDDQYDIAGFYLFDNPIDFKKFESTEKNRWREKMNEKRNEISKNLSSKLSTCEGIVYFFLSGQALFKNETGMDSLEKKYIIKFESHLRIIFEYNEKSLLKQSKETRH